jgi:hypothetical protein
MAERPQPGPTNGPMGSSVPFRGETSDLLTVLGMLLG